jgi:hypothetical protein
MNATIVQAAEKNQDNQALDKPTEPSNAGQPPSASDACHTPSLYSFMGSKMRSSES